MGNFSYLYYLLYHNFEIDESSYAMSPRQAKLACKAEEDRRDVVNIVETSRRDFLI